MSKPIVNIADIEPQSMPESFSPKGSAAELFEVRIGQISPLVGAQKLGYNLTSIQPGKRAFPFHNHRINEEMFFVLEGSGEVRIGAERHPIRQGDIIACPPGGPESAHQIINTGNAELKYLAVSTLIYPEICDYPDSKKFLVTEGQRGTDGKVSGFRHIGRTEAGLDYWDGE
jgi:uncharacterized cupin superfamily protein